MGAWNCWYHVTGNTYGTWLPGDPRGWREKGHKRHVDGDYKTPPPPGTGERLLTYSRDVMAEDAVSLNAAHREIAGKAMVAFLVARGFEVIVLSCDAIHFHLLSRFPDGDVRRQVGHAKVNASYRLRDAGRKGKVWALSCGVRPIADRPHQVRVFNYIREHKDVGAWVWTLDEGMYWE